MFERPRDCPREKYNLQNTKNSNKNLRITYEQFTSFQILNFHEFISVELPLQSETDKPSKWLTQ